MNKYVTGAVIRKLRENKKMTQEELADIIHVSSKAVSKWETGNGFPDISLLEPLAEALGISVIELLSGEDIRNENRSFNMAKCVFYVCPICGNVVTACGEAVVSCCGITLPPQEAEQADVVPTDAASADASQTIQKEAADVEHMIKMEIVEDEYYVTVEHSMTKDHYISFVAAVSDFGVQLVKLYPEGSAEARFKTDRVKRLYAYCNRHGLFRASR